MDLRTHLVSSYGADIDQVSRLDSGVYRVHRHAETDWVARMFGAPRTLADVEGDAAILQLLEQAGFPAERCVADGPVTAFDEQTVIVTEWVEGERASSSGKVYAWLGGMLGRLHSRPATTLRVGGGWHHLVPRGGPDDELAAALEVITVLGRHVPAGEGEAFEQLVTELDSTDTCTDLPQCFSHPDFVPANAITTPGDDRPTIVDWTNAGRGPRLWSLGFLLWAAGAQSPKLVDLAMSRYARSCELTDAEWDRLPAAIRARPLMIDVWSLGAGRKTVKNVVNDAQRRERLSRSIAERARQAAN
jgi:Ser/Thr protein kinase RdoA (MazF antagonist)